MPKRGQVIDTAGNGIPGVSIISSARYSAEGPLGRSVTEYPYRVIAQTSANGRYTLPATFQHLRLRFPGTDADEVLLLTAFKPGYVITIDRSNFSEFNRYGDFKRKPASTSQPPTYSWRGPSVEVAPIVMQKIELDRKTTALYYKDVIGLGWDILLARDSTEMHLREMAYAILEPQICSANAADTLDNAEAGAYAMFVQDPTKFDLTATRLASDGVNREQAMKFTAGIVCQAMKDGEGR
jgi:hypothetical protein